MERAIPNATEAERSILSTCMQEPDRLNELEHHGITKEHFYLPAHGIIYDQLKEMKAASLPIDLVTICQKLADKDLVDMVGGNSALVSLSAAEPTSSSFGYYIQLLKEKFGLRSIIESAMSLIERAYENNPYSELSAGARKDLQEIDFGAMPVIEKPFREEVKEWGLVVKERIDNPDSVYGSPISLSTLNQNIRGIRPQEFIVVAAKPSQGKSALMLQWGLEAACHDYPVLVVSYEMGRDEILDRWCACGTKVEIGVVQETSKATDEEKNRIRHFVKELHKLNITFKGNEIRELSALVSYIEKWTAVNPNGIIVLDYIQLVKFKGARGKTEEIENTTRELKSLVQRCNCCIIAGSQLNKEGVVKGSESIWEDASILIRITVNKGTDTPKSLHLKKFRNGKAGDHYPICFHKEEQKFIEVEETE